MNLTDLIQALKQAENTAITIWPNAAEFDVFCYGEHGKIRKIVVTADGNEKMSLEVKLDC